MGEESDYKIYRMANKEKNWKKFLVSIVPRKVYIIHCTMFGKQFQTVLQWDSTGYGCQAASYVHYKCKVYTGQYKMSSVQCPSPV